MSYHGRLVSLLDRWAAILPERIAEEDIGGFIEQLHRKPRGRFGLCLLVVHALLSTGYNAIRETPFLIDQRLLRRIVMWIAVMNTLFAISLSHEPIEFLTRSPGPLLFVQCLAGVILSVFWVGSGLAMWRRWPVARHFAVGAAAATLLYTVWLSDIMGSFGLVVYTVYPLAVLVVFAASPRETP
jgi:hypothetical protein